MQNDTSLEHTLPQPRLKPRVHTFFKSWGTEGCYMANPYSEPTNIMCHNTTVSCLGGHTPKICAALS